MKTKLLFSCALVTAVLIHVAPIRAANEPKDKTPWKIKGQLEEACSCDAACPCWFNSKPTKMTCGGGQVLTPGASKKTQTRYAPITRKIEGKEHQITIGQYGTFHGHLVEGGMGGSPKIVNPPGADPLHHQYEQGRTTKMTYNDADQNWSWSNSNYMLGTFSIDSVKYEKFAAGLAQKMAGMKNEPSPEKK